MTISALVVLACAAAGLAGNASAGHAQPRWQEAHAAASGTAAARDAGSGPIATIVDAGYGHCLDSDYDGHVYLNPCQPGDYYQQWQGVGATLVNVRTGLCLDSSADRVYTDGCIAGDGNQTWGGGSEHLIGNRQTRAALTVTDPSHVVAALPLGLRSQNWTVRNVPGPYFCGPSPLKMVIDQQKPDIYSVWPGLGFHSPSPSGSMTMTVSASQSHSVSAQTSFHAGLDLTLAGLQAPGVAPGVNVSADLSHGVTKTYELTYTDQQTLHVPLGVTAVGYYGTYEHDVIFHWFRMSENCDVLLSGEYELIAPYATGFTWTCTPSPGCLKEVEAINNSADVSPLYPSGPGGLAQPAPSSISYTGPATAEYQHAFTASAQVTSGGKPVDSGDVTFRLGSASCTATAGLTGRAACRLTPRDGTGPVTLRIDYGGTNDYLPSSAAIPFTVTREATTLTYTGPGRLANGVPLRLSGVLMTDNHTPVTGRAVEFAIGSGATRQACTATSDDSGMARCTIAGAAQPLNDTATVPATAGFGGDALYLPSHAAATLRLEYYTGRASGITATVGLPLLSPLSIGPAPDTGPVRTAAASRTVAACTLNVGALVIGADSLCPSVTTRLAPGTVTAVVRAADVTVGLPGLPVIAVSGLTVTSTSTCTAAIGSATMKLTVAGQPVAISTAPDTTLQLPGGIRLVTDEQTPAAGGDPGLTVNGIHLLVPGPLGGHLAGIVIGSAVSAAHNCR